MSKEELINNLFTKFEKDKDTMKNNLLKVMDLIHLETENKWGKITMQIRYEMKR